MSSGGGGASGGGAGNPGFGPGTLATPGPPYGSDLWGISDLDASMSEISGLPMLGQALCRRISTPRGTLVDDPNYGYDVTAELNDDLAPSDLPRIGSNVDAQFKKDERVFSSSTTVTLEPLPDGTLSIVSSVVPAGGPSFTLTLSASAVTVTLLQASY
jgi:hypothetical protein